MPIWRKGYFELKMDYQNNNFITRQSSFWKYTQNSHTESGVSFLVWSLNLDFANLQWMNNNRLSLLRIQQCYNNTKYIVHHCFSLCYVSDSNIKLTTGTLCSVSILFFVSCLNKDIEWDPNGYYAKYDNYLHFQHPVCNINDTLW